MCEQRRDRDSLENWNMVFCVTGEGPTHLSSGLHREAGGLEIPQGSLRVGRWPETVVCGWVRGAPRCAAWPSSPAPPGAQAGTRSISGVQDSRRAFPGAAEVMQALGYCSACSVFGPINPRTAHLQGPVETEAP